MRGSSHVTHPYRLQIAQGGLTVEPQAIRSIDPRRPASDEPNGRSLEGVSVLLVEDFADSRDLVTTILENAGAVVTPAADSSQALAALDRGSPDLILADIGLPGEDGFDLMRKVRARSGPEARVPAIALTAWGMPRDRARAKEVGYQAHLVKPIEPAALISVLEAFVAKV